jgi:hypothetical protein
MTGKAKTLYVGYTDTDVTEDDITLDVLRDAQTSLAAAVFALKGWQRPRFYRFTLQITDVVEVNRKGRMVDNGIR